MTVTIYDNTLVTPAQLMKKQSFGLSVRLILRVKPLPLGRGDVKLFTF